MEIQQHEKTDGKSDREFPSGARLMNRLCSNFVRFVHVHVSFLFKRGFFSDALHALLSTLKNNKQFIINKANVIKINAKHITWALRNAEHDPWDGILLCTEARSSHPYILLPPKKKKKLCPSTFISTISEIISSSIIHSLILCFDNSIQFDAFYFCSTNYIKFIIDENMKKKSSPQQLPINPYFASFSLVRQRDIQFHGKKWLNLWC